MIITVMLRYNVISEASLKSNHKSNHVHIKLSNTNNFGTFLYNYEYFYFSSMLKSSLLIIVAQEAINDLCRASLL